MGGYTFHTSTTAFSSKTSCFVNTAFKGLEFFCLAQPPTCMCFVCHSQSYFPLCLMNHPGLSLRFII